MNLSEILETYEPFRGWRANFVVNLDGEFHDEGGSSRGISSLEDRSLLKRLRQLSDVVLVSAKTASVEKLSSTKLSTLAIVAGASPLKGIPALTESNPVLVIAPRNSTAPVSLDASTTVTTVWVSNLVPNRISPLELLTAVGSLGFESPIVEFGPDFLRQMVAAGAIDEVCLTITKQPHQAFVEATPQLALEMLLPGNNFLLASFNEFEDNLFTRWQSK